MDGASRIQEWLIFVVVVFLMWLGMGWAAMVGVERYDRAQVDVPPNPYEYSHTPRNGSLNAWRKLDDGTEDWSWAD